MSTPSDPRVNVEPYWVDAPGQIPTPVNQIVIQKGLSLSGGKDSGEVILSLGHSSPPVEQLSEDVTELNLPIYPVAHLALSFERLEEISDVLNRFVQSVRDAKEESGK